MKKRVPNSALGSLWRDYLKSAGVLIVITPFFLAGCATGVGESDPFNERYVSPVTTPVNEKNPIPPAEPGSLWANNSPMSNLFVSDKAKYIGDILMVSIVESAIASNNADTKTERKSDLSARLEKFFNVEQRYPDTRSPQSFPFLNPFSELKAGLESTFDGSGTTRRSGKLAASISVRVSNVLANGNLAIAGSREVTVNNERQYITLTGIVRPQDISADNVVQSTYISDARIAYSGVGVLNDRQRPGWMARILDFIWPF